MTIRVNIGEAEARLSELVAAALRGEEVVLDKAGEPQVRLTPVAAASEAERERIVRQRMAAFGMYADRLGGRDIDIRSLKPTKRSSGDIGRSSVILLDTQIIAWFAGGVRRLIRRYPVATIW